jgi:hypothetical protein
MHSKPRLPFALDTHSTATLHSSACTVRPLERQLQVCIWDGCFKKALLSYWSQRAVARHDTMALSYSPTLSKHSPRQTAPYSNPGYRQTILTGKFWNLSDGTEIFIWCVTPCSLVNSYRCRRGISIYREEGFFLVANFSSLFTYFPPPPNLHGVGGVLDHTHKHTHTHTHSVWLLSPGDQLVAESATYTKHNERRGRVLKLSTACISL